jgi:hypothetical protein
MSIELKEVACLFEGTKELAILVQDNRVTEQNRSWIFMMADAKFWELACLIGSITAKPVMPQQNRRYASSPSKLEWLPALYASTKITEKGASMGKWYMSSEDVLRLGLESAQPGQALHIFLV